ncbi:hypothetical protein Vretimale_5565 [Volvox reticuliferus]|uniref:Uncharacterized protein n=1 Tax=Volvox reticuliferus TaxID=1737510 RepID=A0A8J4FLP1_9CHLO|nr:hypothetical protein Vretifemale_5585 [Volvox reticuliferus]GIM00574.1 hypothetical protein Vretimale_5565 [Volvox reticuliferus]
MAIRLVPVIMAMTQRRASTLRLVAALLILILGGAAIVKAMDTSNCDQAGRTLPDNPHIKEFVACVNPARIDPSCCSHLPMATPNFYDCLTIPSFVAQVKQAVKGKTDVTAIRRDCKS